MARKRIPGTRALFEETEAVAEALAHQPQCAPRDVPISRIVPSRFNPRQVYSREALDELTKSMHDHGFLGALDGRELPDGRIELAYGSRRLLAGRHAGLRTLPVVLHDWTDTQMCLVSLAENMAREGLSGSDEAVMVCQLYEELQLTSQTISDATGMSTGWVEECLALSRSATAKEEDPDAVKLDEVMACLIGDAVASGSTPSVYGLEVSRDMAASSREARDIARLSSAASHPLPVSNRDWYETGCAMLEIANDALRTFDPDAVADDEIEAALDWLAHLEEQLGHHRAALQGAR